MVRLLASCGISGYATSVVRKMPNGKRPRLKSAMDVAGVSQIDVFVNSHHHDDHFGGIDELVDAASIGRSRSKRRSSAREDADTFRFIRAQLVCPVI